MNDMATLQKMYSLLREKPYVKGTKKTLHQQHGRKCNCGHCNKYGYLIKDDGEILETEKHIQQWKTKIFKTLNTIHYQQIQQAQKNSLIIYKIISNPMGLDTWL